METGAQEEEEDLHYDPVRKNGVIIDGMTLPPKQPSGVPWEEHVAHMRSLELRSSDVFICAYPKAGTHWLWEVSHMLLMGKVEYEKRTKENLMMDFLTKGAIDSLPSPRILNTHLPFSMLPPAGEMRAKGVRVLHVYRNPKDTLVSMHFHFRQVFPNLRDHTLMQFLEMYLREDMIYGNYFVFLRQMETFVRENPDIPVFQLSYESMKRNPLEHVRRLAEFLGTGASEELCEKIAEACDFDKMKRVDQTKTLPDISQHTMTKETKLYRKGQAGDWKNHLTVTMNEMMDAAIQKNMADLSYTLHFT
ncbi:hypothetical protein ACOMHN_053636 [Nucella lapillus]